MSVVKWINKNGSLSVSTHELIIALISFKMFLHDYCWFLSLSDKAVLNTHPPRIKATPSTFFFFFSVVSTHELRTALIFVSLFRQSLTSIHIYLGLKHLHVFISTHELTMALVFFQFPQTKPYCSTHTPRIEASHPFVSTHELLIALICFSLFR